MKKVVIYTDGACHGNPGPGGWAATLEFGEHKRELSDGALATTNNRMELRAAIGGLSALKESCEVDLFTDSEYVKNGVLSWMKNWKRNGWMTKARKPVKNVDLWRELDGQVSRHLVSWHWLKGHAGHAGNERCDELATEATERIKKAHTSEELRRALKEFEQLSKAGQAQVELGIG
ncbi:MAG: ribonuclease HI [Verrucomicrobiia bacterium]